MRERVDAIVAGAAREAVWLLEFPAAYTKGRAAKVSDLTRLVDLPVLDDPGGRGGSFSYHGPGVRVAVVMLDLRARRKDMPGFGRAVHLWLQGSVKSLGVEAEVGSHPGLWVGKDQLAAVGFRITQWVTSYGFRLNVDPDMKHYEGIVSCGVEGAGDTSLRALGSTASMADVDGALRAGFHSVFGPTTVVSQDEDKVDGR